MKDGPSGAANPELLLKKILEAGPYADIHTSGDLIVDVHVELADEERDYIIALCGWEWRSGSWRSG